MAESRKLTEAGRKALEWLADRPDGRALYSYMPEETAKQILRLRSDGMVREFRGISNFTGAFVTDAGRRALASKDQP